CEHCTAILEGRHVDVLEMDAASNTGVANIREIIDSVHYRAASARYKVYIIDEVHMLSTGAFNALLKTLEEPPEHVKFIFATTEIRKVPVTVLSRCQRFDLRRIEPETMIDLLKRIAARENAQISDDALALITRAAEGSARDATSLLDQAISHGAGETGADQVRAMLGLADRGRVLDLFDLIMRGDAAGALGELSRQYADGADPISILRDLAEVTHWISVVKITPEAAEDPTINPDERMRGQSMAQTLPMRALTRQWQMLLAALDEVARSPNAMMAAEMAVIRLTHVAELPSPEDLVRKLKDVPPPAPAAAPSPAAAPAVQGPGGGPASSAGQVSSAPPAAQTHLLSAPPRGGMAGASGQTATAAAPNQEALQPGLGRCARFEDVVALIRAQRDIKLLVDVESGIRLISYAPGRITFAPAPDAPKDLAQRLRKRLESYTGNPWAVIIEGQGGAPTIKEARDAEDEELRKKARQHPMVQAVFDAFPGAKIINIRTQKDIAAQAEAEALPEVEDEWDPFDEG
ncbi:MAG: DNA polymerase III subunit gamma/tau, partial [Pseudomonadota bacterium]